MCERELKCFSPRSGSVHRKHLKTSRSVNLGRFELVMSTNFGVAVPANSSLLGQCLYRQEIHRRQRF